MTTTDSSTDIILKSIEHKNLLAQKVYARFCSVAVILLFTIFFALGLLSVFLPKPTVSVYENRTLAAMPAFSLKSLFSGKYIKELEAFYADTFPYRDSFVAISAHLDELRGIRLDDIKLHENTSQNNGIQGTPANSDAAKPPEQGSLNSAAIGQSSAEPSNKQNTDAGESYGSIFVYKGRAMSVFGGTKAAGSRYAAVINSYKDALGGGVAVYNLIVPTSAEFYLPEKYKPLSRSQKDNIDYIYSKLSPGVSAVDAYSEIKNHTDEYIYFNTDHHWTALGAYYAYIAFAKAAGFEPLSLDEFGKGKINGFLGTMYGQTQDQKLKENLDYVDYYIPPVNYIAQRYAVNQPYKPYKTTLLAEYAKGGSSYSVFLHGDLPLIKVETENKNGRKIMIVKESFGNAFVPFLVANYQEVHIADLRYFQLGMVDYIKQNGISELLFINNAFAANTNSFIDKIENMKYQKFIPPEQGLSSDCRPSGSQTTSSQPQDVSSQNGQQAVQAPVS